MPDRTLPERLETQLEWYAKNATRHMRYFQSAKTLQITFGFLIPACSLLLSAESARVWNGLLGGAIAAIESYVQFRGWDKNWHRWRATAEALKRERYLFIQKAGPYTDGSVSKSDEVLLAERVEQVIGAEQEAWLALATRSDRNETTGRVLGDSK